MREALRISIDADAIVDKIYLGEAEVTGQMFPKDSDAYVPDLDSAYPYDPDRARELLKSVGPTKEGSRFRSRGRPRRTLPSTPRSSSTGRRSG